MTREYYPILNVWKISEDESRVLRGLVQKEKGKSQEGWANHPLKVKVYLEDFKLAPTEKII